ncbi:MAG: hypothetical protein K2X47_08460 [Bdellovibrionales bacterium]|nr:hypothetical protein [Bdellovibrionales bacterium]
MSRILKSKSKAWIFFPGIFAVVAICYLFGSSSEKQPPQVLSQNESDPKLEGSLMAPTIRKTASQDEPTQTEPGTLESSVRKYAEATVAFMNSLPGEPTWKATVDENGLVTDLQNGIVKDRGQSKESAFEFAKQLFPQLAISPSTLSSNVIDPNPTSLSRTYHYEQTYQDPDTKQEYRVYGGYLTVSARLTDGGIYAVTSGIKELGTPNLELKIERSDVEALIQQKYATKVPGKIVTELTPVVFMTAVGKSELAWISKVELTIPERSRLQTIFSAKDGRFIQERVILFN